MNKNFNGPDLKQARIRTKNDTQILKDQFEIPSHMKNIGEGKTYFIRTYGCQANERDSETLRGILESMGYVQSDIMETSQVVILNTCAIRENAHNKAEGMLGRIKHLKETKKDIIVVFCGCMAQEENICNMLKDKYPLD